MNTRWVAVLVLLLGVMAMSTRASAQRLGPERDLTVPETLTTSLTQDGVQVARTTDGFLVVFNDRSGARVTRFAADGRLISESTGLPNSMGSVQCAAGTCVAVTYFDLFRFREDGTVIDTTPIPLLLRPGSSQPDVAITSSGVLLSYDVAEPNSGVVRLLPREVASWGRNELSRMDATQEGTASLVRTPAAWLPASPSTRPSKRARLRSTERQRVRR